MGDVWHKINDEIDQLRVRDIAPGRAALALALAEAIDEGAAATTLANNARELRTVMADLHKLAPIGEEGDALDDLARRREARRARGA